MLAFFETASAIRVLYERIKEELTGDDFWPLTKEQYGKLSPEEQSGEWFMINPAKLKSQPQEVWILDDHEKDTMLRAVDFIKRTTDELPANSSFLERLLYAKRNLPPILFTKRAEV